MIFRRPPPRCWPIPWMRKGRFLPSSSSEPSYRYAAVCVCVCVCVPCVCARTVCVHSVCAQWQVVHQHKCTLLVSSSSPFVSSFSLLLLPFLSFFLPSFFHLLSSSSFLHPLFLIHPSSFLPSFLLPLQAIGGAVPMSRCFCEEKACHVSILTAIANFNGEAFGNWLGAAMSFLPNDLIGDSDKQM